MRRLSALDAQFLAAERGNFGAHYCGLAVYQTRRGKPITAAKMRRLIRERIGECAPLRWKLVTVPLGQWIVMVDVVASPSPTCTRLSEADI